ncbi:condensation domain-containing protein [Dapis sp. BLCC M126]|uniref:condensation domain-containing protein n=1 Tax=Dapis sp. BLCC M126 TaxID=3400189 RepID=UPI003CF2EA8F
MIQKTKLYQRVAELSPSQRAKLLRKIQQFKSDKFPKTRQRLVAYIVPQSSTNNLESSVLRDYLKAKLPNYMIPAGIMFLEELPRTANGKIDIKALPELQLATINADSSSLPQTSTEKTLAEIWSQVLGIDTIGINDNFFELGGDSILSIQITSKAREAGLRLSPNQLFEQPTIAELANVVNIAPEAIATQTPVTGAVTLTPIQHWFFEQEMIAPHHWHQAMLLEIPVEVSASKIQEAIAILWTHHDALRLSYNFDSTGWQQINKNESEPPSLVQIDISGLSEAEQTEAVAKYATDIHSAMNLADGKLMGVAHFNRGESLSSWLLISLHHLVVDTVSWQILHNDLEKLLLTQVGQLPAKTTSFKTWAEILTAQAPQRQSEADFWLKQVESVFIHLPRDFSDTPKLTEATAQTVNVQLDVDETQALLRSVPAIYNTQINDVLLTALAKTLLQWSGVKAGNIRLDLEVHGREQIVPEIDLSRTIGWFTMVYPLKLELSEGDENDAIVKSVKEQIRQIPDRGIGYGILRYLGAEITRRRLTQAKSSEILFNYLGQSDRTTGKERIEMIQDISVGQLRDLRNSRSYLLEINAWVANGQLQLNWIYDKQVHQLDTISTIAKNYISTLKSIILQCIKSDEIGFSPSDFPDVELNQTELDEFLDNIT